MIFKDREEAAQLLLKKLIKYKDQNPLVLGIPRGAMPMARIIAEGLNGELNAVLIHKIPAPHQEELAIGSVGLSGEIFRLPLIKEYGIKESYIQEAAKKQIEVLKKRKERFQLPELRCQDRIVIIVDDGIATGATALGAIHEVRSQSPRKLILAAGVVAQSTAASMRSLVDEFVVLDEPEFFFAVSEFFSEFDQVTDDEVVEILKKVKKGKRPPEAQPRL
ncbi:phosphoribosyltransferase [Bdellovibrio sp.]|uniref:phosphoribosyltransferase n=1 Tax=Bdellovibrio sp. TaxID=28201 RepID=UPI0039E2A5E7